MKVRFLCGISDNDLGRNRAYHTGEVCEVAEERALHFVKHGLAEVVVALVPAEVSVLEPADLTLTQQPTSAPEAAALAVPPEHAVDPRARKRG